MPVTKTAVTYGSPSPAFGTSATSGSLHQAFDITASNVRNCPGKRVRLNREEKLRLREENNLLSVAEPVSGWVWI